MHLFDQLDQVIDVHLAPPLKISRDMVKIFLYFVMTLNIQQVMALPLGIGMRFITKPWLRLMYNALVGLFCLTFLARDWVLFVNGVTVLNYVIIRVFEKRCFVPVVIASFAALGYAHYLRWINQDQQWKIDFNVIQMILTCRYVYFAAEFEDGKLTKLNPSFFEYYSYILLFTNMIVGTLPFSDFVRFARLSEGYSNMKFTLRPALVSVSKAILFTIGEMVLRPKFDFAWFVSERWQAMSLLERQGLLMVIAFCARLKYFLAFKYTQAAMDGSGITYSGDGLYENHSTADYRFETECNTYVKTTYWNSTVQMWLKNCFYDRYSHKYGSKTFYITFIVSAFWHGFFFIYYFFFIEWAVFNQVTKYFYKARSKFAFVPKPLAVVIAWIYTHLIVNACAVPVALLQWERGVRLSNDLYWSAQILVFSLFVFFFVTQWGQSSKKNKSL